MDEDENNVSQQIVNCSFSGAVVAQHSGAGIVGWATTKVENCTNYGNIYETGGEAVECSNFGGVIGYIGYDDDAKYSKLINKGNIKVDGDNVGGVVGTNHAARSMPITDSYNTGNVSGNNSVGGIVGSSEGDIINSYNTGNVTGKDNVGGLLGVVPASDIEIQNSYNTGSVSGNNTVGGLTGSMQGAIIDSYNTGKITGKGVGVGGLAGGIGPGGLSAGVFNSYNKGNIEGSSNVGGLVGVNCIMIVKCYNTGNVKARMRVGGLVGVNVKVVDEYDGNFTTLEKCYSIGKIEGVTRAGGIVGENSYSDNANIQNCYYLKDSTINVNNTINGISNSADKQNTVEGKLKEFFPIYLDKNADASYENLGYKNPKPELPFTDIKKTDWYYNSVKYVYSNKIILGKTDTLFKPNDKLTRGQLVTILWRMAGGKIVNTKNKFTDVKISDYYYEAVRWASANKVVNGVSSDKFAPNKNITREQLAVMLNNYAKYKKQKIDKLQDISQYKDVKGISNYAVDAVKWAIGNKIISGKDKGTRIDPRGNASRAEASAMIQNYYTYVK